MVRLYCNQRVRLLNQSKSKQIKANQRVRLLDLDFSMRSPRSSFRLSSHAVITNSADEVLLLKANYGDGSWGLPGGALEPSETIHY